MQDEEVGLVQDCDHDVDGAFHEECSDVGMEKDVIVDGLGEGRQSYLLPWEQFAVRGKDGRLVCITGPVVLMVLLINALAIR